MPKLSAFLAVAAAIAAPVAPAAAQTASDRDSIVVEGRKSGKVIRDFVETLTPVRIGGQIARFHFSICPAAVGLPQAQNDAIVERVRQVAAASGARVAPKGCTPDLFVVVTEDKAAKIEQMKKHYRGLVAGVPPSRLKQLAAAPGPAAAWHVMSEVSADGTELDRDIDGVTYVSSTQDPSRLRKATAPSFAGAVVVVESRALAGISTRQLADYATMRALAPIDPLSHRHGKAGGRPPAPSILTLLDEGAAATAPESVTWWDFAFLKALYSTSNAYAANLQRGEMSGSMARTLADAPADEK